jgi:hypothetical protein
MSSCYDWGHLVGKQVSSLDDNSNNNDGDLLLLAIPFYCSLW